jgi:hypothetical protein
MRLRLFAVLITAAAIAVVALQPLADGASPSLSFVVAEGKAVTVPAQTVTADNDYQVVCPKNYIATGHGLNLGATRLVFADPDPRGRGFSFAFLNTDNEPAPNVSATVICVRGKGLKVRAASLSQEDRRLAVEQARKALRD